MLRTVLSRSGNISMDTMRLALVNYILSRQNKQQFFVRIADLGNSDTDTGKEQDALALLKKFAITQDQLFYQSDSLGRYQQLALSLVEQGEAFVCLCAEQAESCEARCASEQAVLSIQIKTDKLPYTIRIRKPKTDIAFKDTYRGEIKTAAEKIGSPLLLDTKGMPSACFATACDDMLSGISTVVESEAWIENTPKQIHVKHSLGYTAETDYLHLPTLGHPDDPNITALLEKGFLPDAIINFLLSSGYRAPTEYFTLPDAIHWFTPSDLQETASGYDLERLRELNRKHLENMDDKQLSKIFGFADLSIGKLLKLYLEETATLQGLKRRITAMFTPKPCTDQEQEKLQNLATLIQDAPIIDSFSEFRYYLLEKSALADTELDALLRPLMTGRTDGPRLELLYPYIKSYITEIARCTS